MYLVAKPCDSCKHECKVEVHEIVYEGHQMISCRKGYKKEGNK